MASKTRVTILDDHQSILDGYLYRLSKVPEIQVVDAIRFGNDLKPSLASNPTDVLILDISAPLGPNDPTPFPILHFISTLLQDYPDMAILIISMHSEPALVQAVLEAGATGYVLKDDQDTIQNLGKIVLAVAAGGVYFSERIQKYLTRQPASEPLLSPRQLEALCLAASYPNSTTAALAHKMGIANSSIRNLLSSAYLKLGVGTRAAAIAKARQMGILVDERPAKPDAS
ncbi:MAG TPA: response regulator transcription factor [Anaerolineales bacterium]